MTARRGRFWWLWLLLGVVVGFVVGSLGGVWVIAGLLEATGESAGWEVLVGVAGAPLTFGPLGAALGAALALRPELTPDQRRWLLAAVATALAAGMVVWLALGLLEALAVSVWALTAAVVVWLIGSRRR